MKAYICNQCGTHHESLPGYDLPPEGWYEVRLSRLAPTTTIHVCSLDCLVNYAHALDRWNNWIVRDSAMSHQETVR